MPKVRAYTEAQRREEADAALGQRVKDALQLAAMRRHMSLKDAILQAGLNYATTCDRLAAGRLRVSDLAHLNAVLHMDPAELAKLVTLQGKREGAA